MKKFLSIATLCIAMAVAVMAQSVTYTVPNGGYANQLTSLTATMPDGTVYTNTFTTNAGTGVYANSPGFYTTNNCTNISGIANLTKAKDVCFQVSFFSMTAETTNKINFVASNSLDKVTWCRDAARDFTVTLNGAGLNTFSTNQNAMGGIGYEKFAIGFVGGATAYGVSNFNFGYGAKNGL